MADGGETKHGKGVLTPVHLVVGLDSANFVDEPLDGPKDRIEPGALSFEHARQINANRAHS